jgi:hypothetical protein
LTICPQRHNLMEVAVPSIVASIANIIKASGNQAFVDQV